MPYSFKHILGDLVIDNTKVELGKGNFPPLPKEKFPVALAFFKDKKYFQQFHQKNIAITKEAIRNSVNENDLVTQTISNITELDKSANLLSKRLREWYSLYFPELAERITTPETFAKLVAEKTRGELMQELQLKETMGAEFTEENIQEMQLLAQDILVLYSLREQHERYLEKIMQKYCPNLLELAGVTIGANLMLLGKGLRNLALLPSSTIQLLGAEKALFRHLKTGSRSPKYGFIHAHPLIQKTARENRGKAARALADKLSLCARLDYFKGEFKAPQYKKELEEKFFK